MGFTRARSVMDQDKPISKRHDKTMGHLLSVDNNENINYLHVTVAKCVSPEVISVDKLEIIGN